MSYLNYVPLKKKKKLSNKTYDNDLDKYKIEESVKNRKKYYNYIEEINKPKVYEENLTDISKKYMDFDSTYRNRNLYPNPCDYNVPVFNNNTNTFTSYYQNFVDLIDDATPISNSSKPANLNVTGYSKDELHIQLDQSESNIPNFYVNTTIEIDGDFRNVVYYDNITKVVTVDRPFVAIPQPGKKYTFRKFKNFYTANIVPIELKYIPGQTFPIVNKISGDKSVNQLSILSSNFSISKQLYLNSIIRFLNGPHREKTSSITSFDQIVPQESWVQEYYGQYGNPNNQADMELINYYNSKGLSFLYTGTNYYYLYTMDIRVFSSQASRLLIIELFVGDLNIPETIQYYRTTSNITVVPYTEQTVTIYFETPVLLRPQRTIGTTTYNQDTVNVFIQDVTDGGNANGFINLIGSNNSLINVELFGFQSVPYLTFQGFSVDYVNQINAFGNNSFISTSIEQGIRIFNQGLSLPLYFVLDTDVFDDTTNRILQVKIIEGQNLNNTVLYSNNISLNNSVYNPLPSTIFNNYNLSSDETYTTYWLYSNGLANFVYLPNKYNVNHNPCSYVVPSDINQNSYIVVTLTGNSITGLNTDDLILIINNSGSNTSLYTKSNIAVDPNPPGGAFTINFKIDNALDLVLNPEQNLDFIFAISSNINTVTNPITNFTMTITLYNYPSNQIELYKLDTPLNINSGSLTFTNTTSNYTCWLYSGAFNYLPNGYNDTALPSSYTIPANYQNLAGITLTFNGFTDGILNANDFILKVNISGTSTTLKSFYNPSVNTINFSVNFYITPSDNIPFIANQQLDFILCINTINNTFRYTQLNVDFRYIDNSYYTGPLIYLNPNSYYTVTFQDVTPAGNNNTGYINFNGYIEAPEINNTQSLITTNFNGFCPCLKINAINVINKNEITIWDNFASTDFVQSQPISTSTEQYVIFVANSNTNINDITLNLMCFQSTTPGPPRQRLLQVNFYDSSLTLLGTGIVAIPYTLGTTTFSSHLDYIISGFGPIPVTSGNNYLFSVRDVTGDNNANGYIYIYGGNTDYSSTINFDIFPRFFFNTTIDAPIIVNNSTLNPFDIIPVGSEVGFEFVFNQNIGVINPFLIALSSFSSLNLANPDYVDVPNNSQRTIRIKYRLGSGVAGAILYQKDYQVENLLEPYITSIFLSDLSLDLTAGQPYTLTLEDVTPGGNALGATFFYGINSVAPYNSFNSTIYPLLYLSQVFYYVTISPAMPLSGFLNNGFDEISFNSLIRENYRPLNYRGLPYTEIKYYEIRLKHLIMPNKILKVCNGGYLDNYPFFYVEIFNEGDRGNTSIMYSNNNNQNVIFKVYIDKTYYDQPTSFFVLKTYNESEQRQILAYRPDKDTRIRILMPDGQTVVQYQENDYLSPSYPNPLLQTNILLSIRPVNNFNALVKNDFVELFE
jgi:hypothetical protein